MDNSQEIKPENIEEEHEALETEEQDQQHLGNGDCTASHDYINETLKSQALKSEIQQIKRDSLLTNSYEEKSEISTDSPKFLKKKRPYFSESEINQQVFDQFGSICSDSQSLYLNEETNSIDSDEHSRQLTCLSDKTTDRGNWSSYQYSTIIGLDTECKMCYRKECGGCRYVLRYGRSRLSGGVQVKQWLSVPNVRQRRPSVRRKMTGYIKTPSLDETDVKRKFTRSQKTTLVCIGLVNFASFLAMSIIAPFFPREAAKKGMREAVSGFVFSVYALVMMIASPIFGKLLPHTGTNFMYLSGILVSGGSNMLFGVLDRIHDETTFAVFCFLVRSFEALGAAAFSTASYTIILDMFPDDISTVFGLVETCVGVGMSLGPAIGGGLYSVGGYGLPFFVLGGIVLVNIPLSWCMLGKTTAMNSKSMDASYKDLISVPLVITASVIVVVASQAVGFIDPTLEPHLRQFSIGPEIVGLLFLVNAAAYALFSPVVGYVISRWETKYPVMLLGLLMMTVSLLLLGPSPFLPFTGSELWLNILAIALLGISFALSFIPTFEAMLNAGIDGGLEDNMGTYCLVSGLWNSMCSLGEVAGPSLGGLLSDFLDFPLASTAMAVFSFGSAIMVLFVWLVLDKRVKNNSEDTSREASIDDSDRSPLLNTPDTTSYYQRPSIQRNRHNEPILA